LIIIFLLNETDTTSILDSKFAKGQFNKL